MTGFIAWLGIAISHYRFRRGYVAQGRDLNDLPYRSGFFPLGPIFAFVLCLIITLGQNYQAFLNDSIDWYGVTQREEAGTVRQIVQVTSLGHIAPTEAIVTDGNTQPGDKPGHA